METSSQTLGRRSFLGAAAAFTIVKPHLVRGSARNSAIRFGLLGCGGRGTGVAESFTSTTPAQYVALADLFQEQTEKTQARLNKAAERHQKAAIGSGMLFHGPDALERLAAAGLDVIHIATPPYFHPAQLEAAVAAGKHVYLEKPVAVDVPGCRRVIAAGRRGEGKVSIAVGFQLRHATPYVQLVERVHRGDLGALVCGLCNYYAGAIPRPPFPSDSPQARRLKNWVHDRVLSGDILVEQNIHLIDATNWVLRGRPVQAQGTGGRAGRVDAGDCWSHFNVNYTYPGEVHVTLTSTQFIQGAWDVAMKYFGAGGNAEMRYDAPVRITGPNQWEFPGLGKPGQISDTQAAVAGAFQGALDDADAQRQKHFIESIASGRYVNEAARGAESTLSAILGRQAAYTGRPWTWDELLRLEETWDAGIDLRRL